MAPTIFVIMSVCECIRLYFGYLGNLQERVPELAAFWMVTLILQIPLCLLSLLNTDANVLPLEVNEINCFSCRVHLIDVKEVYYGLILAQYYSV